jgi:hypothetical protein
MDTTDNSSITEKQTVPEKPVDQKKEEGNEAPINKSPWSTQESSSPTDLWGDQRMNPVFLKVADYFGIGEKEYRTAQSKLVNIIDWASKVTQSKKPSDILLKISETSKSLQSPGWGERRYAILYRYIRLLGEEDPVRKQVSSLNNQLDDIEKEKKAYHAVT